MSCKTNGCTGACCTNFSLPYSIEDFQEMKKRKLEGHRTFTSQRGEEVNIPLLYEIDYIADMLIPLGLNNIDPQKKKRMIDIVRSWPGWEEIELTEETKLHPGQFYKDGEVWSNYFTCKHFDTDQKMCTAYDKRPYFCRSFGHEKPCCYQGCSLEADQEKYQEALKYDRENVLTEVFKTDKSTES